MTKGKVDWSYALLLRGVKPRAIPLSRLGEYLKQFAALIGESNEPKFAGVVTGSAKLRASVPPEKSSEATMRLLVAASGGDGSTARAVDALRNLLEQDQLAAKVVSRDGRVFLDLPRRAANADLFEYLVQDTAFIDGVVVGIEGVDETVHVRLRESSGRNVSLVIRDLNLARQLALHFRGDAIRAHVHGTWRRSPDCIWEPKSLYLDRFEVLDGESAKELLDRLSKLPGNEWSTMDDPEGFLHRLRSDE